MAKESEVEKTARFKRHLLKGMVASIIIVIIVVAIGVFLVWHQVTTSTPASANSYTIYVTQNYVASNDGTRFKIILLCMTNSPTPITFSSSNIRYNEKLGNTYTGFVPQLMSDYYGQPASPISQITLGAGPWYAMNYAYFDIVLPEGVGSPWVSHMTITITIQTNTAQGSITLSLPAPLFG